MSLSEISQHNRSSIDPIQLVMLSKNLQFSGQDKVVGPLLRDLRDLEEAGVELGSGQIIKGGFTENLSKSTFFCCYCIIHKDTFQNAPTEVGHRHTKQSYQNSFNELCINPQLADVHGIKFDSVLKNLKHFHVCDPGLW